MRVVQRRAHDLHLWCWPSRSAGHARSARMKRAPRVIEIAVIPGDGIGGEVIAEGVRVLDRVAELSGGDVSFDWVYFPWGCPQYLETGRMMDGDGLPRLQSFEAIYFGAVGWPTVPDHISLWGLRLAICQGLDQYANVRPVRLLPGVQTPLRTPPDRIPTCGKSAHRRVPRRALGLP